ncbi:hypothetical protein WMY93_019648 [Mugilogobius chulae]|uniref:Uncharacterized protein n=1 Tax=Mugilogobius chulae TaxID=88201 RepID=A0AAW0NQ33_9GOBI
MAYGGDHLWESPLPLVVSCACEIRSSRPNDPVYTILLPQCRNNDSHRRLAYRRHPPQSSTLGLMPSPARGKYTNEPPFNPQPLMDPNDFCSLFMNDRGQYNKTQYKRP